MPRPLFEILTRIPHSLVGLVLAEWLVIKDFCRLDSAFCRKELRAPFLELLSSGQVVYPEIPSSVELLVNVPDLVQWLSKKGILMFCLEIIPELPVPLLTKYVWQTAHLMKRISIQNFRNDITSMESIIPVIAKGCPNNLSLLCSYCDVTPNIRDCLLAHKNLKHFRMRYCNFIKAQMFADVRMPKMEVASVMHCPVADDAVIALTVSFPNLRLLNLSTCGTLTDSAVLAIAHNCPHLKLISLCGQEHITDAAVVELSRCCTALTIVDLGSCTELTDRSILALTTNCANLDRLYMKSNANFTDASLAAICEHCHAKFDVLNVVGCPEITPNAIERTLEICAKITVLYIGGFVRTEMVSIISKCANLEKLALEGSIVETEEMLQVAACCPKLLDFGIPNCLPSTVDQKALAAIVLNCRLLETLVVHENCSFVNDFTKQLLLTLRPKLTISSDVSLLNYDIEAQVDYYVRHNSM